MKPFGENFLWGAATAAAQIEGGCSEGGRTPSIWDVAPAEKIKNGENCHIAADHFHRMREDVALMKKLGLKSYRFSVSWPRVVPAPGKINAEGLKFYSDLVDELLAAGIMPLVTLYHWDMPVWADALGGWESKAIIGHFLEYAAAVVDALSDRVKYWITFNEPSCFLMNGYMQGVHAPFKRHYLALPKFTKIFMRTNAETVALIRKRAKKAPKIGLSFAAGAYIPKDEGDPVSVEEARKKTFNKGMGTMNNRWWMDPILAGRAVSAYGIYRNGGKRVKEFKVNFDFIGINHYEAFNYSFFGGDKDIDKSKLRKNSLGWVIDERSIYWTVKFVYERYRLPIMITENGIAWDDKPDENGEVNDNERCRALDGFVANLARAMQEGVPVIGYQHWSLMDNFEWAEGYEPRFGLIYVDYKTGKRTLKKSALHYAEMIKNGASEVKR